MPTFLNMAKESTTTTGTGTINLGGADTGFQTFLAAGASTSDVVRYKIEDGTAWEIGEGTFTDATPDTMTRTLLESSTGSLLNLSGADVVVYGVAVAEDIPEVIYGPVTLYTSNDTWTKPKGISAVRVWTVGGGGGGGGASSGTADSGQAGSFGAVAYEEIAAASLGATETVTIGAAGTGGSSGSNNGTSGGNSSFGSHHTANGGAGGYHATHGSRTSAVSAATATGGDVNVSSLRIGNDTVGQETTTTNGALVSVSPFYLGPLSTSGGGSVTAGDDGESTDANAFGSSGSGGDGNSSTNVGGGDGASGCVMVQEIF